MPRITSISKNLAAFLDMIAASEIGEAMLAATDDGYNVKEGSTPDHLMLFDDYSTHPTDPEHIEPPATSTAAGRYQLLHRYYRTYAAQLGLYDFSPVSQDRIAVQQIRECLALPLIEAGRFDEAVQHVAHVWASLPGAGYEGQHENRIEQLRAAYEAAGGVVAA